MKKKLLVLGAGNAQIDLIEYAKSIGLEVYACSYTNTDKGIPKADVFAQINITDAEKIESYVKENKIDYIYSVGSDIAVPTFCKVSENLNMFHFVSAKTAEICCNKHLMRKALGTDNAFNVPFTVCQTLDEARSAHFYPLMIKPVDSQGQRGVFMAENFEELTQCFERAMSYSRNGKVILEKHISGNEVSVNAYVKDGEIIFSMLSDRESFANLPGGIIKAHHLPSVFEKTKTHEKINMLVRETAAKLEIENGPVYFQIKVSEGHPYLIEVTPRLDGCHMWRLIKQYCGVDLLEMTVKHLLGESICVPEYQVSKTPVHTEFFCEAPDTVFNAGKYESFTADYKRMYYNTGDTVKKINGYMEKCGYRIFGSPRKIGLVGGSGFIGSCFQSMYSNAARLCDVSRKSGAVGEYTPEQLEKALYVCDSVVIFAAKKVNPDEKQSFMLYEDNIKTLENTLIACVKLGIKNIVYLSSRCVYANTQKSPVGENGEIAPINYYGISKYSCELLCDYYNRNFGTNIKILRLSQVVGNDRNGYLISRYVENASDGKPLAVYGNALGKRDYIYVKDACFAIWLALDKYLLCGVYNIGSGTGTSNAELAKAVIDGVGSSSEIKFFRDKKEDVSVCYLNTAKAKNELGFECSYSLTQAFGELSAQKRGTKYENTI